MLRWYRSQEELGQILLLKIKTKKAKNFLWAGAHRSLFLRSRFSELDAFLHQ